MPRCWRQRPWIHWNPASKDPLQTAWTARPRTEISNVEARRAKPWLTWLTRLTRLTLGNQTCHGLRVLVVDHSIQVWWQAGSWGSGTSAKPKASIHLSNGSVFPTCQVRVVRFYQSCSSPPQLALLLLLLLLFSSTMSASISTSTSALPTLRQALCQLPSSVCTAGPQPGTFPAQCALLDLNRGPSQLSVHRWTSTWDLPSSVCTAGPQPGTCPAQCAPLDLNLGPSQLSVHRWTSTAR